MSDNEIKQFIQKNYSQFLLSNKMKPRIGQRIMIAEIYKTIFPKNDTSHINQSNSIAVIEAGTGTGKTLSYSLAGISCALETKQKLIISTATIALQEQLLNKDLPALKEYTDLDFSFTCAKGRSRYVCLYKLDNYLVKKTINKKDLFEQLDDNISYSNIDKIELSILAKMQGKFNDNKWDGDKDHLEDEVNDKLWRMIITDNSHCFSNKCSFFKQCPYFTAREKNSKSDVIIANHDLILSDLALGGGKILPEPSKSIFIFDEAHHLPQKAVNHGECFFSLKSNQEWLSKINNLIEHLEQGNNASLFYSDLYEIKETISEVKYYISKIWELLVDYRLQLNIDNDENIYRFKKGFLSKHLSKIACSVQDLYKRLIVLFRGCIDNLSEFLDKKKYSVADAHHELEQVYFSFGGALKRIENAVKLWSAFLCDNVSEKIPKAKWLKFEIIDNDLREIIVCASPVVGSELLFDGLWCRVKSAILTSATLTSLGTFERFSFESGLSSQIKMLSVPNTLNYENGLLQVPFFNYDPTDVYAHTSEIVEKLPFLIKEDLGVLVLFSSRQQMVNVYSKLDLKYRAKIFIQGDQPKEVLIKDHKNRIDEGKQSILFGLSSFSEGIDLPGKYCNHVVVAKIPFMVPGKPVESALVEWIENNGENSFFKIILPDASRRLKQACGRLLRCETDVGKITILDKRLKTKSYGKQILKSLPPYRLNL